MLMCWGQAVAIYFATLFIQIHQAKVYILLGNMQTITNLLGFTAKPTLQITLDPHPHPKFWRYVDRQNNLHKLPVYKDSDSISGTINVAVPHKLQHLGLRVQLIGHLQIYSNSDLSTDFTVVCKQLQPAGTMTQNKCYSFQFQNFQKPYESFSGALGRVHYCLRAILDKTTKQLPFAVLLPTLPPEHSLQLPVSLQIGIEQCLNIQLDYNKSNYHLKDCLLGKVTFNYVHLPIREVDIDIERREILDGTTTEKKVLVRYEIADGCPVAGQVVQFRMFLVGVPLTPTYKNIHNRLQVKYYFNFVFVDGEGRRYFRQQEVAIYRSK